MLQGSEHIQRRAKTLRRQMSLPEMLLWQQLKGAPQGYKFRKQHPCGEKYVADFYCHQSRLVIEIDGQHHGFAAQAAKDALRDAWFAARQIAVLRLPAGLVIDDLDAPVSAVMAVAADRGIPLRQRCALPPPLAGEDFEEPI